MNDYVRPIDQLIKSHTITFTRRYIAECQRQGVPCDGEAYDLSDAYADWMETQR